MTSRSAPAMPTTLAKVAKRSYLVALSVAEKDITLVPCRCRARLPKKRVRKFWVRAARRAGKDSIASAIAAHAAAFADFKASIRPGESATAARLSVDRELDAILDPLATWNCTRRKRCPTLRIVYTEFCPQTPEVRLFPKIGEQYCSKTIPPRRPVRLRVLTTSAPKRACVTECFFRGSKRCSQGPTRRALQ